MRTPTSPQHDLLPTKRHSFKMTTAPKYTIVPVRGSPSTASSVLDVPYALDGVKCREPLADPSPFAFQPSNEYQLHGVSVKPQPATSPSLHSTSSAAPISRFQMSYHLHKQHLEKAKTCAATESSTSHRPRNAASIAFLLS